MVYSPPEATVIRFEFLSVQDVADISGHDKCTIHDMVANAHLHPVVGAKPMKFYPSAVVGIPKKTTVTQDDVARFIEQKKGKK